MTTKPLLFLTIVCVLIVPGCIQEPTMGAASTTRVGGGSGEAIVVGVYEDRVERFSPSSGTITCPSSDWRVSFTTDFTKVNGTYVYDSRNAKEYSVKANDTELLAALNQTMRTDAPAILSWTTLTDAGCEYQHPQIVTGVAPHPNATPTN